MGDGKLIIEGDWKKRGDDTSGNAGKVNIPGASGSTGQPAGGAAPQGGSSLNVDADWKQQAQAERERLAEAEAKKAAAASKAGAPAGAGGAAGAGRELPAGDFQTLVSTLMTQALMYMGAFPDPQTGRAMISLEYARLHIDLLQTLEEKTKGNLTPAEKEMLEQVNAELRMQYVELGNAVAKAIKEGRLKPGAGGLIGGPGTGAGPQLAQ